MTIPYPNEIAFIICSLLGGMMHYTKKFLRKETDVGMFQWFGKSNWVSTFYTVVMFIFVTIGALAGGIINSQTDFWAVLYTGFITGFAVDAGFNSDKDITRQLIDTRNNSNELFNKDSPAGHRAAAREEAAPAPVAPVAPAKEEADAPACPNPQLDDEPAPVAAEEKPKRRRRKPVEGSPAVPPKPIE